MSLRAASATGWCRVLHAERPDRSEAAQPRSCPSSSRPCSRRPPCTSGGRSKGPLPGPHTLAQSGWCSTSLWLPPPAARPARAVAAARRAVPELGPHDRRRPSALDLGRPPRPRTPLLAGARARSPSCSRTRARWLPAPHSVAGGAHARRPHGPRPRARYRWRRRARVLPGRAESRHCSARRRRPPGPARCLVTRATPRRWSASSGAIVRGGIVVTGGPRDGARAAWGLAAASTGSRWKMQRASSLRMLARDRRPRLTRSKHARASLNPRLRDPSAPLHGDAGNRHPRSPRSCPPASSRIGPSSAAARGSSWIWPT